MQVRMTTQKFKNQTIKNLCYTYLLGIKAWENNKT
jgi:hypothetical protein